ncbi:MAG: UDP-2,3-diacylglucosamine diphosphatase [Planctomycetes bacterium]|nr:UDP-2,3-diacylglucosamine diphosphatase [Planctomycetota bacterium]
MYNPQTDDEKSSKIRYRTVFISDVHLGSPACKANLLFEFLKNIECDTLYLVGDIIDGWRMKRSWFWHQSHTDVIQRVLKLARKGTRIVYIPGNHDEGFRGYAHMALGNIEILREDVFETAGGKKFLVVHGDEYDAVIQYARWLAVLGDKAYDLVVWLNGIIAWLRAKLGLPYKSVAAYLKSKVKNAVKFIENYEVKLAEVTKERGLDGVICGHIHNPQMTDIEGVQYINDGDWVENCTALVELEDGTLELINWPQMRLTVGAEQTADVSSAQN